MSPPLPELPQAEVDAAVTSARAALERAQSDTPEAIARLAGQILVARGQLATVAELALGRLASEGAVPEAIGDCDG